MRLVSGELQNSRVATPLPTPLVIEVLDANGHPFPGAVVQWSVTAGAGTVSRQNSATDATGRAQVTWTLGTTAGEQRVSASSSGLTPVVFTATATPDLAASVEVTPNSLYFKLPQDTARLWATVVDRYGNTVSGNVAWVAADSSVAVVEPTGLVTARAVGLTTISAVADTASASVPVQVGESSVAGVRVISGDEQRGTVGVVLAAPLVVEVMDNFGRPVGGAEVVWSVISGGGVLSAETTPTTADGRAQVSWVLGTGAGGQTAAATVSALAPVTFSATGTPDIPASVVLSREHVDLAAVDDTARLQATVYDRYGNAVPASPLEWSSADSSIVAVDSTGLLTARGIGETTVTATADTARASATVAVVPRVAAVGMSPDSALIEAGDTVRFSATPFDSAGQPVAGVPLAWSSSAPEVASVDSAGLATGHTPGTAVITATGGTATGTATLRVAPRAPVATTIELVPGFSIVDIGRSTEIVALAFTEGGDTLPEANPDWRSLDPLIATVTDGIVTGQGIGTSWIEASIDATADTALVIVAGQTTIIATAFAAGHPRSTASRGDTTSVAVTLDLSRANLAGDLGSVELDFRFDAAFLEVDSVTSALTGSWFASEPGPGHVRFVFAGAEPQPVPQLTLAVIHVRVRSEAPSGSAALTISFTRPPTDSRFVEYEPPLVVDGQIRVP